MTAATTITPNVGLYASIFFDPNPDAATLQSYQNTASDLASSGFTFVNLWFFGNGMHVDNDGNLRPTPVGSPSFISGGSVTADYAYVPQLLSTVTASGSSVNTVRMTIGGWGCNGTFDRIAQLLDKYGTGPQNPLYANLAALTGLGITGIDLDLEPGGGTPVSRYTDYVQSLSQLVTMASAVNLDVTFCPYQCPDFWFSMLQAAMQKGGKQPVRQINLQCYAGETQAQWVHWMNQYVAKVGGGSIGSLFGISDAASFIAAGFGATSGGVTVTPDSIQQQLTTSGFATPGISSAYIFASTGLQNGQQGSSANPFVPYANALIAGINAVNGQTQQAAPKVRRSGASALQSV